MKLVPGDYIETSFWLTGTETEDELEGFKRDILPESINQMAKDNGITVSDLDFEFIYPGTERCPPVPDHISGPDVRCIIAFAMVTGYQSTTEGETWLQDLDYVDREFLRNYTRKILEDRVPNLTEEQCDFVIGEAGFVASMNLLKSKVSSTYH